VPAVASETSNAVPAAKFTVALLWLPSFKIMDLELAADSKSYFVSTALITKGALPPPVNVTF
jgi:hypothetical protein